MTAETRSIWLRDAPTFPALEPLASADAADVIVVGAGIAGLSVALSLLEQDLDVLVLEKDAIGAGQTQRTSAHLASALDDRFYRLEHWHGAQGARNAAASHADAIDRIEAWIERYGIACDFARIDGFLVAARDAPADELGKELAAAARAGLEVEHVDGIEGLEQLGPALRFARQARFHPLAYLAGLARAVADRGGRFARADVVRVEGGDTPTLRTADGLELSAGAVVLATNVPFHETVAIHTKQAPYRTFVIGFPIAASAFPDILLWDTGDPYHYVRRVADADGTMQLIVGGADHKTGQPPSDAVPFADLDGWTRARFGGDIEITSFWSGQVLEPVDGLAFIGRDPGGESNVYVATGDSGNGLTHGTLAGRVIADLVAGRDDPWNGLYDPRRKPLRALGAWLAENANVAAQYGDWVAAGEARPLQRCDGTVVRHGVHRIAVHRDEDGALHAFAAQCPHLGCSVRWNATERSFDCPCHGSRFDPVDGHVLNGPAAHALAPIEIDL